MSNNTLKYNIISPDGFRFLPEPVGSYAEIKQNWKRLKEAYARQGYYSTIFLGDRLHIPVNKLHKHCYIIREYAEEKIN